MDRVAQMLTGGYFARTLTDDRPPARAFPAEYAHAVLFPALGVRLSPPSVPSSKPLSSRTWRNLPCLQGM